MSIELLLNRNSAAQLIEPAPEGEALQQILRAAMRAPDHGNLKPWRFISVTGARRTDLGELFAVAANDRLGNLTPEQTDKFVSQPLRAPLVLVVVCSPQEHPKVPFVEQQNAAACAAFSVLLAAEALGFAGIWRTGENAFDETVMKGLGLSKEEEITGFLYIGSRKIPAKTVPEIDPLNYWQVW